jgi:hypothetical protein
LTTALLATTLVQGDRIRSFAVRPMSPVGAGWEVRESADESVTMRRFYTDWHRVERTLRSFSRTIDELRSQGWQEV